MDEQIKDRFRKYQEDTQKYLDLDIESLNFQEVRYSDSNLFKFIKGQNKYIQTYITANPGDVAVLGSSLNDNCISNYIKPISDSDVIRETCVSFNKDNAKGSRAFVRDYPFVMDRHHLAIITDRERINVHYFQKYLDKFLISQHYGWGENVASVEEIRKHKMIIPTDISEVYNSVKLQEIIAEFIEYYELKCFDQVSIISSVIDDISKLEKAILPLFFKGDNSIKIRFNRYCVNNGLNLKFEDIKFETKRLVSDDSTELICYKRMGFTPKRINDGDINWYTVRDLNLNEKLTILTPSTKEKTTMELIKDKVSETSSKFLPIKKGDVLVSFKLTVGVVKIYESDLPAYCNEAIDILSPYDGINSQYLAYNCLYEYPKYGTKTNNGITLNDDDKKKISISIPLGNEEFTSYQIQSIIVDFFAEYLQKLNFIKSSVSELSSMYDSYIQAFVQKTLNPL